MSLDYPEITFKFKDYRERAMERMADIVAESLDCNALDKILGIK
jgi:cobyric acid synthase